MLAFERMKKADLIKQVVKQHGVEPGTAADQMDQAVNQLVRALRSGKSARLPGLGTISPGKQWVFRQDPLTKRGENER
jgi:nucleoid DNA-binding protein